MQEIHAISGGGRFFGGAGGGDRRLRPHNHHQHHQNHQALKCPRCDSLNTKFCYYNNYNLSQPRHFCKNCRRYWTKGGVLRNVPVGGGCRKSKRSNNKPKNSSSETTAAATTTSTSYAQPPTEPERKSNSHSSSESSSLTAAATEAVSAPASNSDPNINNVLDNNMHESKLLIHQSSTPNPLEQTGAGDCGIFSEIGSFTSLITSANEALAFGFGNNNTSPFRFSAQQGSDLLLGSGAGGGGGEWQQQKVMMSMGGGGGDHHQHHHHHQDQDLKLPEIAAGSLLDHTVPVDLSALHNKTSHEGFGSLDWHGGADQGLFDLSTNTVDHAYWSHTHWPDHDNPSLFHLP